jgi:hypothetical protein
MDRPADRAVFLLLLAPGVAVLASRGKKVTRVLTSNSVVLVYFDYCLASTLWSDYPDVSVKRCFKAVGDLVMVLIVVTDADPKAAFKRWFRE